MGFLGPMADSLAEEEITVLTLESLARKVAIRPVPGQELYNTLERSNYHG
jgi:hypothetical protein